MALQRQHRGDPVFLHNCSTIPNTGSRDWNHVSMDFDVIDSGADVCHQHCYQDTELVMGLGGGLTIMIFACWS